VGNDAPLVVVHVAESAGGTLDLVDDPVEALGAAFVVPVVSRAPAKSLVAACLPVTRR
jgi:hypothetical protein